MHPRTLMRDALALAITGNTDAGTNVFAARVKPLNVDVTISIGMPLDTATKVNESPPEYRFQSSIQLAITAKGNDGKTVTNAMDAIIKQIENEVMKDDSLGDTCEQLMPVSIATSFNAEGATVIGESVMTFSGAYYRKYVAPDPTATFSLIELDWDLAPKDQALEAEDSITLPQ